MRKRIFAFLMAFILTVTLASGIVVSQAASKAKLLTVDELMEKFPNGKYWNHGSGANNPNGWTDKPCTHHSACSWYGTCGCNSFENAIQCWGFVLKLAYDAYGVSARKRAKAYSFDAIKPGDIVVYTGYYGSEHYIFVTAIKDGYVYFGDANGVGVSRGCEIRWGRKTVSELKSKFSYTYSAPYALKESSGSTETPDTPSSFLPGVYTVHTSDTSNIPLNVRASASTSAAIVGQLDNGTVVNVTEVNGSWGKITYKNITGWISLEYATCTAPTTCSVVVDVSEVKLSDKLNLKFSSDANVEYVVTVTVKNSVESLEVLNTVVSEDNLSIEVTLGGTYLVNVTARNAGGKVAAKTLTLTVDYCPGTYIVTCAGTTLRVRSAPISGDVIGSLRDETTVKVTEISGVWGKISYDGKTGWICLDYTEYESSDPNDDIEIDIILGDINGDKGVDIEDAMLLFYHVAGRQKLAEEQLNVCDFNADDSVDIADAMILFFFVAGRIDSLS